MGTDNRDDLDFTRVQIRPARRRALNVKLQLAATHFRANARPLPSKFDLSSAEFAAAQGRSRQKMIVSPELVSNSLRHIKEGANNDAINSGLSLKYKYSDRRTKLVGVPLEWWLRVTTFKQVDDCLCNKMKRRKEKLIFQVFCFVQKNPTPYPTK